MITGARSRGFQEIGIDAGALIENFKDIYDAPGVTYDGLLDSIIAELDSDNCLGITRGGNHFVSEAEQRQIEFDGQRVRFKGDAIKGGANPTIETTLLEFSIANLKRIMPSSTITTIGNKTVIREQLRIEMADYMKSLSWVRERKDGAVLIVTLFNPMNIGNVDIPGEDNNEAAIPVTFTGFNDDFADLANAPYEIVIFTPDGDGMTTNIERLEADRATVESLMIEIPLASQGSQTARTTFVRNAILAAITYSNVSVSSVSVTEYVVTLYIGTDEITTTIMTTDEV